MKELRGDVRDIRDRLGKLETDFGRRIEAVEEKDKTVCFAPLIIIKIRRIFLES